MSLEFDTPEEELEFYRGMSNRLLNTLHEVYHIILEIDEDDMSPRMTQIAVIVGDVVDPDDPHPHDRITVSTPWDTEEEIDLLMAPVLQALWDAQIAVTASCQGDVDEEACEEHRHRNGYLVGRKGYPDLVKDVINIMESNGCKNVHLSHEGDELWVIHFDALELEDAS